GAVVLARREAPGPGKRDPLSLCRGYRLGRRRDEGPRADADAPERPLPAGPHRAGPPADRAVAERGQRGPARVPGRGIAPGAKRGGAAEGGGREGGGRQGRGGGAGPGGRRGVPLQNGAAPGGGRAGKVPKAGHGRPTAAACRPDRASDIREPRERGPVSA